MLKLNLPSLTLELYRGTELVRSYPVAIGDSAHPTPQGVFEVTQVDWDPWWIPPASDWAKNEKVTPPGPRNPMGRVRLSFRELYFIHGTPDRHSVGSAASHGCVRLYNTDAIDLAKRILRYGAPDISSKEVDQIAARRGKTRTIKLQRTVAVEIRNEINLDSAAAASGLPSNTGR
jgi:murein L,D-transpeptidase YcbB/YkuD